MRDAIDKTTDYMGEIAGAGAGAAFAWGVLLGATCRVQLGLDTTIGLIGLGVLAGLATLRVGWLFIYPLREGSDG